MKMLKKYWTKIKETIANISYILGLQIDIKRFSILNRTYLARVFEKICRVVRGLQTTCCRRQVRQQHYTRYDRRMWD